MWLTCSEIFSNEKILIVQLITEIIWQVCSSTSMPLLTVPNVTAHPSMDNVPIIILLYNEWSIALWF